MKQNIYKCDSIKNYDKKNGKDLIIIGNGFDMSLGLKSNFSRYIKTYNDNYKKVTKFLRTYKKYNKNIFQIFNELKNKYTIHLEKDNHYLDNNNISINKIANDYFNIKYLFKYGCFFGSLNYSIDGNLFKHIIPNTVINKYNKELNNMFESINRMANDINIDFWDLLLIFQEIESDRSYKSRKELYETRYKNSLQNVLEPLFKGENNGGNSVLKNILQKFSDGKSSKALIKIVNSSKKSLSTFIKKLIDSNKECINNINNKSFNDWSDVENAIKYFMTSIYSTDELLSKKLKIGSQKNLSYYFKNASYSYRLYFKSYIYINYFMGALNNLVTSYVFNSSTSYYCFEEDKHKDKMSHFYDHILNSNNNLESIFSPEAFSNYYEDPLHSNALIFLIQRRYQEALVRNNTDDKYTILFKLLKKDIKLFERNFRKYLLNSQFKYSDSSLYKIKKSEYLNKSFDLLKSLSPSKRFEVLDFNYTPLRRDIHIKNHIHGSLQDKNIIIGIDDTEINSLLFKIKHNHVNQIIRKKKMTHFERNMHGNNVRNSKIIQNIDNKRINTKDSYYYKLFPLTKTYRILENNKSDNTFDDRSFNNLNNIVFFGHSLGINDYPYFEAIFDRIDLYNSNTKLVFGYDDEAPKESEIPNIVNLLRIYGQTMNNKVHGGNLISKMLIENRIRFLDTTKYINDINLK